MDKNDNIYNMFLAECDYALRFLIEDYEFAGPSYELDEKYNLITVTYYKKEIAIECIYEERDDDVSVRIVRLENGVKPDELCRKYLTKLLLQRGIRDLKFSSLNDNSLSDQQADMRKALCGYARLLREYGKDILSGSAEIFKKV